MRIEDISVRELKLLSELPYYGSLRALARAKGYQPAHISKLVRSIETKLNVQVLKRSTLGIVLTQQGAKLSREAGAIVAQVLKLASMDLSGTVPDFKSVLTWGSRGFLNTLLSPVLGFLFEKEFPGVGIRMIDLSPDETHLAARTSHIDFALSLGELDLGKNFIQKKVGHLDWALFARKEHALRSPVSPRELANFRIVQSAHWNGKSIVSSNDLLEVDDSFKRAGHEVQTAWTALALIQSTNQLAYIPRAVAMRAVREGTIRELEVKEAPRVSHPIYLAVQRDNIKRSMYLQIHSTVSDFLQKLA
jgi:DNA-binding transcriptional LysR family regulator